MFQPTNQYIDVYIHYECLTLHWGGVQPHNEQEQAMDLDSKWPKDDKSPQQILATYLDCLERNEKNIYTYNTHNYIYIYTYVYVYLAQQPQSVFQCIPVLGVASPSSWSPQDRK